MTKQSQVSELSPASVKTQETIPNPLHLVWGSKECPLSYMILLTLICQQYLCLQKSQLGAGLLGVTLSCDP